MIGGDETHLGQIYTSGTARLLQDVHISTGIGNVNIGRIAMGNQEADPYFGRKACVAFCFGALYWIHFTPLSMSCRLWVMITFATLGYNCIRSIPIPENLEEE